MPLQMKSISIKYLFTATLLVVFSVITKAQSGLCPPNLDFEMGNFTNWNCEAGIVDPSGNLVLSPTPPIAGRHTIISAATAGTDPYGGFSENCPNGSGFSLKLGNDGGNHEAEGISYTYTIPASLTSFSILFNYAIVLNDDPTHTGTQKPHFRARIVDLTTNLPLPCVDFDFTSGAIPGFRISPITGPGGSPVYYKDWTPISINLNGYIGRTVKLEFYTNDCIFTAHFGYAYMDVNTVCNGAITGNFICPGDTSITLSAPAGFQDYRWFSDAGFSSVISNTQTLTLNPPPAVGSVFPIEVTPHPGFGCKDTLYAVLDVGTKPNADAGADAFICQGDQVQIGAPPNPIYAYEWVPAAQVNNAAVSNPFAWTLSSAPESFIVKATDILTGCKAYDTVIINTKPVDTTLTLIKKKDYCIGDPQSGSLSVNSTVNSVQWYESSTAIGGANGFTYTPVTSGNYWAQVTQSGCVDSTAIVRFDIRPIPVPSFTMSSDTGCATNNSFTFTNTSIAPDGAALSHLWKFNDGSTQTTTDAIRSYTAVGDYSVKLITTSSFGCIDSTASSTVHVLPNGRAGFTWDSICTLRPVQFYNLSDENASPDIKYRWTFNNGGPGSALKQPFPVVYSTAGKADVTLVLTALGCENYPDSVTKTVQVNVQKPGVSYRTITVPQGSSQYLHVRDSVGDIYDWRPHIQLSSYDTRYTQFYATGNDVKYLIHISDIHTCVTIDTQLVQILKKPGYYLPTAFTPNNDGLNDDIQPYLIGMKGLKSFSVFDRWGKRIFFTTTYGKSWDGKMNGVEQPNGVYVWVLEFYNADNQLQKEKGTVTIIR